MVDFVIKSCHRLKGYERLDSNHSVGPGQAEWVRCEVWRVRCEVWGDTWARSESGGCRTPGQTSLPSQSVPSLTSDREEDDLTDIYGNKVWINEMPFKSRSTLQPCESVSGKLSNYLGNKFLILDIISAWGAKCKGWRDQSGNTKLTLLIKEDNF